MTPSSRLKRLFPRAATKIRSGRALRRRASRGMTREMSWGDLLALTAIFFGPSIATSISATLAAEDAVSLDVPEFTTEANWGALAQQAFLLALGGGYIYLRRLKLLPWSVRPTVKGTALGAGLFVLCGIAFDIAFTPYNSITGAEEGETEAPSGDPNAADAAVNAGGFDPSLVAYSAFNGFYEEFFFLVVCLSLPPKWRRAAMVYSLVVRGSFHTYQGIYSALVIGLVFGSIFYAVSRALPAQRIYPFVLAHALADYFGTGIYSLVFPAR